MNEIDGVACGTPGCDNRGKPGLNLVGYGSFATKSGRRQRYRCTVCRGTRSTNTGTAYSGLVHPRSRIEAYARRSISTRSSATPAAGSTGCTALRALSRWCADFGLIELQADGSAPTGRSGLARARSGSGTWPPLRSQARTASATPAVGERWIIAQRGVPPGLATSPRAWSSTQDAAEDGVAGSTLRDYRHGRLKAVWSRRIETLTHPSSSASTSQSAPSPTCVGARPATPVAASFYSSVDSWICHGQHRPPARGSLETRTHDAPVLSTTMALMRHFTPPCPQRLHVGCSRTPP